MALPIKKWISDVVNPIKKEKNITQLSTEYFFRDPSRPMFNNYNFFYSPADGIILYQKEVTPTEKIVEIKGKNYTLRDILFDATFKEPCVVIGIFMSFYDVHINRVPYKGKLTFKDVDSIESYNYPMLFLEKQLISEQLSTHNMGYLQNNARRINTIESKDMKYYVVQIADYDVDVFHHFVEDNEYVMQNERFSFIRWGSQCDLIVPLKYLKNGYKFIQKPEFHVEAGVDTLIEIL